VPLFPRANESGADETARGASRFFARQLTADIRTEGGSKRGRRKSVMFARIYPANANRANYAGNWPVGRAPFFSVLVRESCPRNAIAAISLTTESISGESSREETR